VCEPVAAETSVERNEHKNDAEGSGQSDHFHRFSQACAVEPMAAIRSGQASVVVEQKYGGRQGDASPHRSDDATAPPYCRCHDKQRSGAPQQERNGDTVHPLALVPAAMDNVAGRFDRFGSGNAGRDNSRGESVVAESGNATDEECSRRGGDGTDGDVIGELETFVHVSNLQCPQIKAGE
jgi:hypothetical protein